MTTIKVPTRRRRRAPVGAVPPAGLHAARLASIEERDDGYLVTWRFRAAERPWSLEQLYSERDLAHILFDLGFGGQTIDPQAAAGREARIHVRTRGGGRSAFVEGVRPAAT